MSGKGNRNEHNKGQGLNLMKYALNGKVEQVSDLLRKGAPMNFQTDSGHTALEAAADKGHLEIVQLLLDNGANRHIQDKAGNTPLIRAAIYGHAEVLRLLIASGADINHRTVEGGTALLYASSRGHLNVVHILVSSGAAIDQEDEDGNTALSHAASNGHLNIAKLLVDSGANVNGQNKNGSTALLRAAAEGHVDVARLFLEREANINVQNTSGDTALTWAAYKGFMDLLRLLLEHKANVDLQDTNGDTSLIMAASNGHISIVEELLKYKPDVNHRNSKGDTVLTILARTPFRCPELIRTIYAQSDEAAQTQAEEIMNPLVRDSRSSNTRVRWIGFDMDECIGSLMPLLFVNGKLNSGDLIDSELRRDTFLFRTSFIALLKPIYQAFMKKEIEGVFILSNNGSQRLVDLVVVISNWMIATILGLSKDPGVFRMGISRESKIRTNKFGTSLEKTFDMAQHCLFKSGLKECSSNEDLLFFDDQDHPIFLQITHGLRVKPYIYMNPLRETFRACGINPDSESGKTALEGAESEFNKLFKYIRRERQPKKEEEQDIVAWTESFYKFIGVTPLSKGNKSTASSGGTRKRNRRKLYKRTRRAYRNRK